MLTLRSITPGIAGGRSVIEPRNFLVVSPRLGRSRGPSQALATPGPTSVPGHTGVGGTWRMIARVLRERGRTWQFLEANRTKRVSIDWRGRRTSSLAPSRPTDQDWPLRQRDSIT